MAAPEVPSAAGLHALLARQLRRLDIDPGRGVDAAQLGALLERVTRTYEAADQDRYLIERSLEVLIARDGPRLRGAAPLVGDGAGQPT